MCGLGGHSARTAQHQGSAGRKHWPVLRSSQCLPALAPCPTPSHPCACLLWLLALHLHTHVLTVQPGVPGAMYIHSPSRLCGCSMP
eukprot:364263-Chlamydomonas_euryale.AAC.18